MGYAKTSGEPLTLLRCLKTLVIRLKPITIVTVYWLTGPIGLSGIATTLLIPTAGIMLSKKNLIDRFFSYPLHLARVDRKLTQLGGSVETETVGTFPSRSFHLCHLERGKDAFLLPAPPTFPKPRSTQRAPTHQKQLSQAEGG